MNKNQKTKEKSCTFYASDYHFEMISLPYINKKIENKEEVVILTENNLEETIKKLLSNMNLENSKKDKILSLNWKNEDRVKFEKIKEYKSEEKDMIVFIKGKENYIKNINENIEKWTKKSSIHIIDCYDMEEIGEKIHTVMGKYHRVLATSGEKEIQKI